MQRIAAITLTRLAVVDCMLPVAESASRCMSQSQRGSEHQKSPESAMKNVAKDATRQSKEANAPPKSGVFGFTEEEKRDLDRRIPKGQ